MKSKLLKNISWLFYDKIIRVLGGLLIGIWVARYLGPNDFGVLNYSIAYVAMFMLFVKLGLDQIVVREIVKDKESRGEILGTVFLLKLLGGVFAICCVVISFFFIEMDLLTRSIILILSIQFVFQSLDIIDYYYQAQVLSKYVVIARNTAFILSSGLKIFLIINNFPVIFFAAIISFDFLLAALFLVIIYKRKKQETLEWSYNKRIAKRLLLDSWPLAISMFLITIYTKIDQVMIGNLLDKEQVGIYSVAVKLTESWMFIPIIIINTLMPYFVSLREKDNRKYYERLTQLYSLMFWMGLIVGIAVLFFGEFAIKLLFGEIYIGSYNALVFNIWNGIFISQAIARGIWLINENLQKYRLYNNVIAVVLNISLNILLIPIFGITGAAITTLFTQGLGTWLIPFLWKPMRESNKAMIRSINPYYLFSAIRTIRYDR